MDIPKFHSEKEKPLKIGDLEYFSVYDFSLTEKEIEKARKELHETEEKKVQKLGKLRDKLANEKDVNYRTDSNYLLRYLRIRKYDCDKAYQNIKESYIFKKNHPELWQIPENLEQLLNLNIFIYLPYTDENGNIMLFLDIGNWKCYEMSFEEYMRVSSAVLNFILMNPRAQVNGVVGLWDMNGLTSEHVAVVLRSYGPRKLCYFAQNMFPWRMKKVVAFNAGRLTRMAFSMVRPFLSKKFAERIIMLGSDMTELHQYVNPALLPKKLGGFLEEDQCSVTQDILDNISHLKYERAFDYTKKL